ncbi:MAG: glutamate synthase [Verrucomicrobia bacterium]|nr:glutamate synthase [Verrucomicrobiota bacterium]
MCKPHAKATTLTLAVNCVRRFLITLGDSALELSIDDKKVKVGPGASVLDAARAAGFRVPSMCYLEGCGKLSSCMVCLVKDAKTGKLYPSCSAPVSEGMSVITGSQDVIDARKAGIELLLSEHFGDCEGPCRRGCPAGMDIPLMIRQIAAGKLNDAIRTVKEHIALPAVLGRICPAPCEKVCRRSQADDAVSICLLKRFVADADLAQPAPWVPKRAKHTGKRVTIIGAGPCGLSAAYYLLQMGHSCTIYDSEPAAGGAIRGLVSDNRLPARVLEAEIGMIMKLGCTFVPGKQVGKAIRVSEILAKSDVVVLAAGKGSVALASDLGIDATAAGISIAAKTFQTSKPGIFAGGNAVKEGKLAVRSVGHGHNIAFAVGQYLAGQPVTGISDAFDSRMGKLDKDHIAAFMKEADASGRIKPPANEGLSNEDALVESARCYRCDCRKKHACKLRDYAGEYSASQDRFKGPERKHFERIKRQGLIVFEPGKCIKCGICVKVTEKAGEKLGLTFVGRGFDVRIAVPFNESIEAALTKAAKECIESCPTGALS